MKPCAERPSVAGGWALQLAPADANALSTLRLCPGIEVAEAPGALWIRGRSCPPRLRILLQGLPAIQRFHWLEGRQLVREGCRIPYDELPRAAWVPIREWVEIQVLPRQLSRSTIRPTALSLVETHDELPCHLLETSMELWSRFALGAPAIRLRELSFASNPEGLVLIHGTPIPPLPGRRWVLHGHVAVPAGFGWTPRVHPDVLADLMGADPSCRVLWLPEGGHTRIPVEFFVEATRANVRASLLPGGAQP